MRRRSGARGQAVRLVEASEVRVVDALLRMICRQLCAEGLDGGICGVAELNI